jgi:N-acetyl-gamma-glutamyl-phosphate reductase
MIKVGIIGATGYTGLELLRLLYFHSQVEVVACGVRNAIGKKITSEFPNLIGFYDDLEFISVDDEKFFDCDIIFFATPHGVAMNSAGKYLAKGIKVIDLGADFRIKDDKLWSQWYELEHTRLDLLQDAVYGLVEIYEEQIKTANLVANPGCYPTAILLGLLPLLTNNLTQGGVIADCKSGVSGAGRGARIGTLLCEASENLNAYGVDNHRHKPEILQQLRNFNENLDLTFVPHLIPMKRGMLATMYVEITQDIDVNELYQQFYQDNNLVQIVDGQPQTKAVSGTNLAYIAIVQNGNNLIITSAIDNLVKGAAGQAVQNMNLMLGLDKNLSLNLMATNP